MVKRFHDEGLEVILDMVYNHTGEGGLINQNPEDANLLSYALIDNSSYYKVYKDGHYRSNSGCGNDFNILNKGARNQIINIPSFVVRKENEGKILKLNDKDRESRTKKRTKAKKEKGDAEE